MKSAQMTIIEMAGRFSMLVSMQFFSDFMKNHLIHRPDVGELLCLQGLNGSANRASAEPVAADRFVA